MAAKSLLGLLLESLLHWMLLLGAGRPQWPHRFGAVVKGTQYYVLAKESL